MTEGNPCPGIREDRAKGWVIAALGVIGLASAFLPAYTDRIGFLTIQPEHKLVTSWIYGVIRHPIYLASVVDALGWGLAFRSSVGIVPALMTLPPLLARIGSEERLLAAHFGAAYESDRARTSRLIPWIY